MEMEEKLFNSIVEKYVDGNKTTFGKMMSSPALKFENKVFAFFYKDSMTFKLGEKFNPDEYDLTDVELLNPFKNKGPLKGWYVVNYSNSKKWDTLTNKALEEIKKQFR